MINSDDGACSQQPNPKDELNGKHGFSERESILTNTCIQVNATGRLAAK